MVVQVYNLVIKITLTTEHYCPLVFGGGKGRIKITETALLRLEYWRFPLMKLQVG